MTATNDQDVRIAKIVKLGQFGHDLTVVLKWGVTAKYFADCVRYLTGQTTIVSVFVSVADAFGEHPCAWGGLVGLLGAGLAFLFARLRRGTITRLGDENAELRKLLDPDRLRSGLESDGQTNQEDL